MMRAQPVMTIAAAPELLRWEPLTVEQVSDLLRGASVPWWVAGGWALDLFMGRQTRAHNDIDIAVYRDDLDALRRQLAGWETVIAEGGAFTPLPAGEPLRPGSHELWCRERGHDAWQLEVLVEERRGDRWAYRRNEAIGSHWMDIGRETPAGVRYIRPEIQLLYKSKQARAQDESDLITLLPHLDVAQRGFLAAALSLVAPDHRWLARLK